MTKRRGWARVGRWLGLAGLLGVAAGGALVARNERRRRHYTPDEVRARLHERAATAAHRNGVRSSRDER